MENMVVVAVIVVVVLPLWTFWTLVHFQFCVHIVLADSHAGVGLLWLI